MALGRILIIDDDDDNLAYLGKIIGDAGYEVETLDDSTKALDTIKRVSPDMIFLDIQMPMMNGFQVLKAIRDDKALDRIPVVFLSAIGAVTGQAYDPDTIESQYGVRPDAFMDKTVKAADVQATIAQFVTGA